ncbi:MAG TPA: helical backbone metal receptor [Acidimicrobiales bacterium]|nr:helical backbone metal receptor [Acidimicrobiales bacterium]
MSPPRVVSLVPSVTETLLAWGVEPVGVTRFCEQPRFEAVGGTKDPHVARIVELAPDIVVVDKEENRREDADALVAAGCALHVVHVTSVDDVAPTLDGLRAALDLPPHAHHALPAPRPIDTTAFVPIWRRPWMAIGGDTYGASLLRLLGICPVPDVGERYPTVDDLGAVGADVVLAPSEPYPFAERHRAELEQVAPVTFVDGKDLFWWGIRTSDATMARLSEPGHRSGRAGEG